MKFYLVMFLAITACTSAEERQAEMVKDIEYGGGDIMACRAQVYNDLDYTALNARYPQENVMNATDAQLGDNTMPSADESKLLVRMHNELIPCRQIFLNKTQNTLPAITYIYKQEWIANDSVNKQLADGKISWGEALKQRQKIKNETNEKLHAASLHVDPKFKAPAEDEGILAKWE